MGFRPVLREFLRLVICMIQSGDKLLQQQALVAWQRFQQSGILQKMICCRTSLSHRRCALRSGTVYGIAALQFCAAGGLNSV